MKTFIVAELGISHNGDFPTALRMVIHANLSGADAVKFQMFHCFPNLKQYQFDLHEWVTLFEFCKKEGVLWFVTPFDAKAVGLLDAAGMTTWKIPSNSAVINSDFLLSKIARAQNAKKIIISTGISDDADIERVLKHFKRFDDVTLLHCVSKYPCPVEEANLERIEHLKRFGLPVGFSDHSISIDIPVQAVAMGATVIEKHFTLDRNQDGPDHKASLTPCEFKEMVGKIREIECGYELA